MQSSSQASSLQSNSSQVDSTTSRAPQPSTDFFTESFDLSPKQREVFEVIRKHPEGITAADVAEEVGSHVNTIRGHLEELSAQGAISSTPKNSAGRGRPTLVYAPRTPDNRAIAEEYITLIGILAKQCSELAADKSSEIAYQLGKKWAEELDLAAFPSSEAVLAHIQQLFRRLGFAPLPQRTDAVVLHACPLKNSTTEPSKFLCQVHQGMLDALTADQPGLLELRSYHEHGECSIHLAKP